MTRAEPGKKARHSTTWCKICGITRVADAQRVVAAGADAIGLNFYPKSPRCVDLDAAAEISESVGADAMRVGLFVDADATRVREVLAACELDMLQFHGEETAEFCRKFHMPYIKVIRVRSDRDIRSQLADYHDAWAIMLDTFVENVPGGTGQQFDWSLWPGDVELPLVLAGGLDADNVAGAIKSLRPFGVDVAGGVEQIVNGSRLKGVKDPELVDKFVREVRDV